MYIFYGHQTLKTGHICSVAYLLVQVISFLLIIHIHANTHLHYIICNCVFLSSVFTYWDV